VGCRFLHATKLFVCNKSVIVHTHAHCWMCLSSHGTHTYRLAVNPIALRSRGRWSVLLGSGARTLQHLHRVFASHLRIGTTLNLKSMRQAPQSTSDAQYSGRHVVFEHTVVALKVRVHIFQASIHKASSPQSQAPTQPWLMRFGGAHSN
jgi:hypothetical protein